MADNFSWLYSIGIDTTQADRNLADFVGRTSNLLDKTFAKPVVLQVDVKGSTASVKTMVDQVKAELASIGNVSVNIKIGQATKAFNNFMASVKANQAQLQSFTDMLAKLDGVMNTYAAAMEKGAASMVAFKNAANEARLASQTLATDVRTITRASGSMVTTAQAVSRVNRAQGDSFDYLSRVMGNTVFKFIEYQLLMQAFTSLMQELGNSIKQAADIQTENTLTSLYNSQVNTNQAFRDGVVLAKKYGDNIVDVVQTIGVWSKVTSNLATAEFLTAEAMKLHIVSGISTNDVTTTTIALMSKLHTTVGELPAVYDKVTKGAEVLGQVMKNVTSASGKQEGMKDILEGLTESGASLAKLAGAGNTSGIISMIMAQVQGLGESGKSAGEKLSTMFSGLLAGKSGEEFRKIVGPFKDFDDLMDKMKEKAPQLWDAIQKGLITVRPSARETLNTFLSMTDQMKIWNDVIGSQSVGALDRANEAMQKTYTVHVQRMQASFQALTIELGEKLLPAATKLVDWLGNSLFPTLQKNIPMILDAIKRIGELLAVLLGYQALSRIPGVLVKIFDVVSLMEGIAVKAGPAFAYFSGQVALAGTASAGASVGFDAAAAGLSAMLGPLVAVTTLLAWLGNTGIDAWKRSSEAFQQGLIDEGGAGNQYRIQVQDYTRRMLALKRKYNYDTTDVVGDNISNQSLEHYVTTHHHDRWSKADAEEYARLFVARRLAQSGIDALSSVHLGDKVKGNPPAENSSTDISTPAGKMVSEQSKILADQSNFRRHYASLWKETAADINAAMKDVHTDEILANKNRYSIQSMEALHAAVKKASGEYNEAIYLQMHQQQDLKNKIAYEQNLVDTTPKDSYANLAAVKALSILNESYQSVTGSIDTLIASRKELLAQQDREDEAAKQEKDRLDQLTLDYAGKIADAKLKIYGLSLDIADSDKNEAEYLKSIYEATKRYHEELDVIAKAKETSANSPELMAELDAYKQQVQTIYQLNTALAEQKRIRGEIAYQATLSTMDKFGTSAVDNALKYLTHDYDTQKEYPYGRSGERFKKIPPGLGSQIADEFLKQFVGAKVKDLFKSVTDALFGATGEQKIQDQFATTVKTFNDSISVQKPDSFGHWVQTFTDSVGALIGAPGAGKGKESGSTAQTASALASIVPGLAPVIASAFGKELTKLSSSTANGPVAAVSGSGSTSVLSGAKGALSALAGGLFGGVGKGFSGDLTGLMGAVGIGSGIGSLIGGDASSNRIWGAAGGVAGGLLAFLSDAAWLSGPLGILGATVVGSLLGGVFGNHEQAWQMPDVSDTQNYGQFVSNINGAPGTFNGSVIGPYNQYSTAAGNADLAAQLETFVTTISAAKFDQLSPQLQQAVQQLKALGGGQAEGLKIQSERQGVFTLNSGQQISVSDYENLVGAVQQAMGTSTPLAPLISINAYGVGPMGYNANPYSTPGLTSKEFQALQDPAQKGGPFATYGPTQYVGATGSGYGITPNSGSGNVVSQTINLVVDGRILASVVNSINADTANRYG